MAVPGLGARALADGPWALSEEDRAALPAAVLEDCEDYRRALLQPLWECWAVLADLSAGSLVGSSEHEGDLIRISRACSICGPDSSKSSTSSAHDAPRCDTRAAASALPPATRPDGTRWSVRPG